MGAARPFKPGDVVYFYDNDGQLLKGTITKPCNYMEGWFFVNTLKSVWCVPAREFFRNKEDTNTWY